MRIHMGRMARRETALLVLGIASFFLPFLAINWLGIFYVVMSLPLGALVMLAIYYLPWVRIGTVAGTPELLRWHLAHGIRLSQHQVTESLSSIRVQVDTTSQVEVLLEASAQGTIVSYKAAATETGWVLILLPLGILWPSIITLFTAPWIYCKSVRFVREHVAPLLPADGVLRNVVRYDDIGALLVAHASEDHRLFSEAYRADRDTYWDALGIIGTIAFFTWFMVFMALIVTSANPDYTARASDAVIPSAAGVIAFAIPSLWIAHRVFKPRLRRWKDWVARIDGVWRTEATRSIPEDSAPSSFEILAEAAKEAPLCLRSIRKAGLSRDWGSWTILFVLVFFGMQLTLEGIASIAWSGTAQPASEFPILGLVEAIGGVILLIGAWAVYKDWKSKQEARLNQELANWNHRHEELRHRMERFLEELQFDV